MSDTPRTDAETMRDEYDHVDTEFGAYAPSITVSADFARQLERELAEAKFDLQFRRDLYAFQSKELAEAREEISDLQGDVEAWKRETMIANARLRGEKHPDDNGAISTKEIIPKLQRELAEVTKQRDELIEGLKKLASCNWVITLPDRMDAVRNIARETLNKITQ